MITRKEALEYHSSGRKGKIEVTLTKPCDTQRDLSLAYTPGVAHPCLEIAKDPEKAYEYTARGNLVAVVSNGTAVLGLGNLGALGGKPVMEGKGVLFKRFADIDVFDIELDTEDQDEIVRACELMAPTFGGINLEDIKAPECFYIEEKLKKSLDIPVFHDDQHGTAIISAAGLINALELVGKNIEEISIVINGAGAAGIACGKLYETMGAKRRNIILCDTKGVIYQGRSEGMNPYKEYFARDTELRTLSEAMEGADVFLGLSVKGAVTQEMLKKMAKDPIVFAMANPDPEITYPDAIAARDDVIMATGRSDFPNQVNNVLGFPFIFRGALDVRATAITEEMKIAAARALASLAREDVPDYVSRAYGGVKFSFGREYIIPKPVDMRVLLWEAPAVARAAIEGGQARLQVDDVDAWINQYTEKLEEHLGYSHVIMRQIINKAKANLRRICFPEGNSPLIAASCKAVLDEELAIPVLIGDTNRVKALFEEYHIDPQQVEVIDPASCVEMDKMTAQFLELRQREGILPNEAENLLRTSPFYLAAMLLANKRVDGVVAGAHSHYPDTLRPFLQINRNKSQDIVAGVYMLIFKNHIKFFADTTVNIDPTAEQLADIAIQTADLALQLEVKPRIAMLSFSNFGSVKHTDTRKLARAVRLVKERRPDLVIDGEMQADTAVSADILREDFQFSDLRSPANVLIFPNLHSGNIAYKLVSELGGIAKVGPILIGMNSAVNVLQRKPNVTDVFQLTALTAMRATELAGNSND
ncbi:MAG: NADP-dependent malic enzyme [Candidatus Delongbacteria bacterium]|nr:NADP-dependent malic enzyme [Candidatus Delongbacteria bacterium]